MEVALSKMCDSEDIVTPINPPVEGHLPRNYIGFYNHIPASEIKSKVPNEVWNNYYKFCFERNPWDKIVSWFMYRKKENFYRYIKNQDNNPNGFRKSFEMYTIDGKVVIDFLGRYENLYKDFQYVCNKLGLPWDGTLSKEKSEFRPKNRHYSTYYDSETKEIIQKKYSREIDLLGYSFESTS